MLQEFNEVMEYVEKNLMDSLEDAEIQKIAGVSAYHFRRMFSYLSGMSLSEYVKQRRLSEANKELVQGAKVTDVAFRYGYQSLDGFSRAFKEWSGFLPSEVMKLHVQKTLPRFTFYIDIRGGTAMEWKMEKKEAFYVVGVSGRVPVQFEGENQAIVELAQSITEEQRTAMRASGDLYPKQVVNVSYELDEGFLEEKGSLRHMLGYLSSQPSNETTLEHLSVEAGEWAIFSVTGPFPDAMQQLHARIYAEWLPSSDYELREAPMLSFTRFEEPVERRYSEVWVAVKRKG